jgi:hypothetical protein
MSEAEAVLSPALDPGAFAEQVLGRPLWPHQLELARSKARYRVMCAGRQVGKSVLLSTLALYEAATRRNVFVLIVSAGETASRRLLEDIAAIAGASPLLAGSVVDESKSEVRLTNGSRIVSVPASERQIRGWAVDLLIVDEAGLIPNGIWRSAEPAIVARPGSRVIVASSPAGTSDHWYRRLWQRGMDSPDEMTQSWHWPSSVSPMVDEKLIEEWRKTWPDLEFRAECLGEWIDDSGAYFDYDELMACVADYELLDAAAARDASPYVSGSGAQRVFPAVAGVDYGFRSDANALVVISPMEDHGLNRDRLGDWGAAVFVPYLVARSRWPWHEFAEHIADVADAYDVKVIASELNGPGDPATSMLYQATQKRQGARYTHVQGVWTDQRRKAAMFGGLKILLQRGLIVLPRHTEMLNQLRYLEFEQTPGGGMRISVPESRGHDDLALALGQAVSCLLDPEQWAVSTGLSVLHPAIVRDQAWQALRTWRSVDAAKTETQETESGLLVPVRPLPSRYAHKWWRMPKGAEVAKPDGSVAW